MQCQRCGYAMTDFDTECPRCTNVESNAECATRTLSRLPRRRNIVPWVVLAVLIVAGIIALFFPAGMVNGQVFVSTSDGENVKFGSVEVGLYQYDEIQQLLAKKKEEAEKLIPVLDREVEQAKARYEKAAAFSEQSYSEAAFEAEMDAQFEYWGKQNSRELLQSGLYYLAFDAPGEHPPAPVAISRTDADGRYRIRAPRYGKFVLCCKTMRKAMDDESPPIKQYTHLEGYYWIVGASLNGRFGKIINLTNSNLTSSGSVESLIKTSAEADGQKTLNPFL